MNNKSIKEMVLAITTTLCLVGCKTGNINSDTTNYEDTFHIVSSFYPMHILAMNLTDGIDGVTETSMSEPNIGCIHDHTFTTEDLKKIEGADVYIENGLGLETFNEKIKSAYPDVPIVEASNDIKETNGNLHVWTNIDRYICQMKYVSQQLQLLNPEHKDGYASNEEVYLKKLEQLKSDNQDIIKASANKKVLVLDEALINFCQFLQMDVHTIETDHEEEALSADDLKETIQGMKKDGTKTILIGKGADRSVAETIATETGATIYELNTCMVGTIESTKDAYIMDMQENFNEIATIE